MSCSTSFTTTWGVDAQLEQSGRVIAIVLCSQHRGWRTGSSNHRQRSQDMWIATGLELVRSIDPQAVEADLLQPVARAIQHEPPESCLFECRRLTPRIVAPAIEVAIGECGQVVAVRSAELARVIERAQLYEGQVFPVTGQPRGKPSAHIPRHRLIYALQNHDQVGNRAHGERLHALCNITQFNAVTLLLLATATVVQDGSSLSLPEETCAVFALPSTRPKV